MKSQGIPEHKINFTGEVGQALDETTKRKQNASNKGKGEDPKQPNQKDSEL
jgi:hypothetical protein